MPKKFWISKSYSQKNNYRGEYVFPENLQGNAQATLFINSFNYEYIPAIKDKLYFSHLFQKLQIYLFEKEDKKKGNKFSKSSEEFNKTLQDETAGLFQNFQLSSGVDANFHIPSTLVDFFRTLSVRTENDISLFDRGDGVQARFIPEILDEISRNSSKNTIWGFEEPENSYEAKNISKLRDEFIGKYSRKNQIFITTHSKEFLSLERKTTHQEAAIYKNNKLTKSKKDDERRKLKLENSSSEIAIYRVWKILTSNNASFITRFDENNKEWEHTCDDLGIVQEARIIENLQILLSDQSKEIENSSFSAEKQKRIQDDLYNELQKALLENEDVKNKIEEYMKPILVVEDKYDDIYKIAYLKTNDIQFTEKDYQDVFKISAPFTIRRGGGTGGVSGYLRMNFTDGYDDKKVVGLFDFDEEGSRSFYCLKGGCNWNNEILGDRQTGFFKRRQNHDCFYGLLLPIPERHNPLISDISNGTFTSFIEIENLFSDEFLMNNDLVHEKTILERRYLKIKQDAKSKLPKLLPKVHRDAFNDFVPLYAKIESLFGI